jgi:hypothetical protein
MPDKFLRFIHCLLQPNANYTKKPRLGGCCEHSHSNPGSHPLYFNSGATVGRLCHTSTPASHLQLDLTACVAPPIVPQRLRRTSNWTSTPASHLAGTFSLHLVFHGIAYNDAWGEFHAIERSCPSS